MHLVQAPDNPPLVVIPIGASYRQPYIVHSDWVFLALFKTPYSLPCLEVTSPKPMSQTSWLSVIKQSSATSVATGSIYSW